MSSGVGGGISGGGGVARGGGRGARGTTKFGKNSKKFGKNLNNLIKAPAAPPVPVVNSGIGGGSTSSFRGSSSSRNGLLLLSTKSKSSISKNAGGGGLLASPSTPKTAHDALLLSAGAGGQDRGADLGQKAAPIPAWGIGEKRQATPLPEKVVEQTRAREGQDEKPASISSTINSLQQKNPSSSLAAVDEVVRKVETMELKHAGPRKVETMELKHAGSQEKTCPTDTVSKDALQPTDKPTNSSVQPGAASQQKRTGALLKQAPSKQEKFKDDQVEYMSKLAKERAEKLRLEEEARMAAQKERAAIRLRELEEKRRELEEKRLEETKKQQQVISQARKELSKPQVLLEPLGKCKKDASNSSFPRQNSKTLTAEKSDGRKLYDPDCPYSSLVGGKTVKQVVDNAAMKKDGRPRGNTEIALAIGPVSPHGKLSTGQSSTDNKKDNLQPSVQMVQLSNLDQLDRGGRGGAQCGPRMLFDPTSGSMVKVLSKEEPKTKKNPKQNKGAHKPPPKRSDEISEIISFRPMDGGVTSESCSDAKPSRGRQGKLSRKDEPISVPTKNKKLLDNKSRSIGQYQIPRRRFPRTCGVRYKIDKSGNYVNTDGCEPDNGYGAHRAPGGKVRNSSAYAKILKHEEEQITTAQSSNDIKIAAEGFSFRNDPGFLQHQTDFEAQQQKILEDAWASLVENDEQPEKGELNKEELEKVPVSKPADEGYAVALSIDPSMIGLNFDSNETIDSVLLPSTIKASAATGTEEPIDLAKFALEAASTVNVSKPTNPFTSLGVSGASLWGTGTSGATSSSYGDLGALTGWEATASPAAGVAGSTGLNGKSSHASKLGLWGGSSALDALDDSVLGAFGSEAPKD